MRFSLATLTLCLTLGLFLASCGNLPRPFQHTPEDVPNPLSSPENSFDIRIEPVDGVALPMGKLLAESLVQGLNDLGVPSTTKAFGTSRYVLRGLAESNWKDTRAPFIAVINWTLFDNNGETVATHIQGILGKWWNWENGDPKMIRSVGMGAAKPISAMIKEETIPAPVELMSAGLVVQPVEGAPGNGNTVLTRAIKNALQGADMLVTEDFRQATFVLQGNVTMDSPVGDRQRVQIEWTVFNLSGEEVGNAVQENRVANGSLDEDWGPIAEFVAAAAVEGIGNIIGGANIRGSGGPVLEPRTPLDIPQIPGRAPPPP